MIVNSSDTYIVYTDESGHANEKGLFIRVFWAIRKDKHEIVAKEVREILTYWKKQVNKGKCSEIKWQRHHKKILNTFDNNKENSEFKENQKLKMKFSKLFSNKNYGKIYWVLASTKNPGGSLNKDYIIKSTKIFNRAVNYFESNYSPYRVTTRKKFAIVIIADKQKEVQEIVKEEQHNQLRKIRFEDSKSCDLLQMCDIMVGSLRYFCLNPLKTTKKNSVFKNGKIKSDNEKNKAVKKQKEHESLIKANLEILVSLSRGTGMYDRNDKESFNPYIFQLESFREKGKFIKKVKSFRELSRPLYRTGDSFYLKTEEKLLFLDNYAIKKLEGKEKKFFDERINKYNSLVNREKNFYVVPKNGFKSKKFFDGTSPIVIEINILDHNSNCIFTTRKRIFRFERGNLTTAFKNVVNKGQANIKIFKKNKGLKPTFSEERFWSLIINSKEGDKHKFKGEFKVGNEISYIIANQLEVNLLAILKHPD